ncbi:high-potential iron-sulfur protein [Denitrificimonas sp. JX-1]|uniref:High-potential iron-sulfur protein n=1 Tax=Denitrificimonas halotolerans TaxID=3098930 RepID=A0ABU5GMQ7_9GAMM|nr:high-potential iron-sulfur protein [Denitrificimonas sp. JX-1]MDY7218229.1 high-potential iron-sulfur protein [Denitrificimonas sp. JX-1]
MADQSRRKFMRSSLLGIAAIPFGASLLSQRAFAQELTPLEPTNPMAQALNYVKVAEEGSDNPSYKAGSKCSNCMFFQEGSNGCQLFPQNSVEPEGWCQSWVQKP